jgi:hypothetical protein
MSTSANQDTPPSGRQFWQAHIDALAESGCNRREYCRQHNLSYHKLTYWLRKLQGDEERSASLPLVQVPMTLPFVDGRASLRLHIDRYTIELPQGFDQAILVRTLDVLENR